VFFGEAERVVAANIFLDHAGDLTAAIVAALVVRAVCVTAALDLQAADFVVLRVAEIAFLAATDRLTGVGDVAEGVATAQDWPLTGIFAFTAPVVVRLADFPGRTFLVAAAAHFSNADALNTILILRTLGTVTAGRTAFSFDTLLRRQTVTTALASRDAKTGHARLRRRTLGVSGTVNQSDATL